MQNLNVGAERGQNIRTRARALAKAPQMTTPIHQQQMKHFMSTKYDSEMVNIALIVMI